ncbi:hypothetical protein OJAV_G00007840 [Oryzias javanicus]|uniref:Immunoglobulin subtype domain-containing protein n=1 Tax=Oryzias javanicus TaxID=123683 RepID=A0A3S2PL61_ORYJA|nr:hypothetical protein OJAV_G00007840 [Oryzias javanicus]
MKARQLSHLSFLSTLVLFLPFFCTGKDAPRISMNSTVFVAFQNENLTVCCTLDLPVNQTAGTLECFNPSGTRIGSTNIQETENNKVNKMLEFKNMTESGEYYCQYKEAKVYWFLRVTDQGYKTDPSEFIILSSISGVLLISSVICSVFAFKGHWKKKNTECDNTGRNEKQNTEEKVTEIKEDDKDVMPPQSSSVYASLDTRPRSIYGVLDCSAAEAEPKIEKTNSKKGEMLKAVEPTAEHQDEGAFECVYENF